MAKIPGLFSRHGRWTYRRRVPDDLRAKLKRTEIWFSLSAATHQEAARLARLKSVEVDRTFAQARGGALSPKVDISPNVDFRHLGRMFFHELEAEAGPVPFDDDERKTFLENEIDDVAAAAHPSLEDDMLQRSALHVAASAGLSLGHGQPFPSKLLSAVRRALMEHHSRQVDRLDNQPAHVYDAAFANVSASSPSPVAEMTVGQAIEAFMAAPEKAGVSAKTRLAWVFRYATVAEFLGKNRRLAEITRDDVRKLRDNLLKLPPNSTKRWPGVAPRDVAVLAEKNGITPMSPKSVAHYLAATNALFRWATAEEHITRNPSTGVGAQVSKNQPPPRRPFNIPELRAIFSAAPYDDLAAVRGWRFWLPLVALFSGLRLGEIVGLLAAEIAERDAVPVILVRPNRIRNLKTAQSERIVPVHPTLLEIGLLEHARAVPSDGLLFPDLPELTKGYANAPQKHFSRAIRVIIPDRTVVFHSFRHCFRDALREAFISMEISAALGGWKVGGAAMHTYGSGFRPSTLATEIAKVTYPSLDLNHLHQNSVAHLRG